MLQEGNEWISHENINFATLLAKMEESKFILKYH